MVCALNAKPDDQTRSGGNPSSATPHTQRRYEPTPNRRGLQPFSAMRSKATASRQIIGRFDEKDHPGLPIAENSGEETAERPILHCAYPYIYWPVTASEKPIPKYREPVATCCAFYGHILGVATRWSRVGSNLIARYVESNLCAKRTSPKIGTKHRNFSRVRQLH